MSNTVIGKNTFLDNQIHIAHNVKIGENTIIAGQVGIAGSSTLGKNVKIGGQAGISGHLKIGDNVQIAGGSGGSSGNESVYVNDTGHGMNSHAFSYMDTPGAGNHTYKVQVRHHESGSYANYLTVNRSRNGNYRSLSTLTCSEIEI